jgi:hypothetical protein
MSAEAARDYGIVDEVLQLEDWHARGTKSLKASER